MRSENSACSWSWETLVSFQGRSTTDPSGTPLGRLWPGEGCSDRATMQGSGPAELSNHGTWS